MSKWDYRDSHQAGKIIYSLVCFNSLIFVYTHVLQTILTILIKTESIVGSFIGCDTEKLSNRDLEHRCPNPGLKGKADQ